MRPESLLNNSHEISQQTKYVIFRRDTMQMGILVSAKSNPILFEFALGKNSPAQKAECFTLPACTCRWETVRELFTETEYSLIVIHPNRIQLNKAEHSFQ